MNAYDYTAQRWVTGPEAATIRRRQLADELAILTSPRAEEYLRFCGSTATASTRLLAVRAELAQMEATP